MPEIEIEKRYIIMKPDCKEMSALDGYSYSSIVQTYLRSIPGVTHRIRRREYDNGIVRYTETVKKRIDRMSSYEDEREISEEEYESLLEKIMPDTQPLEKVRHTFVYRSQLFEIDVYPGWANTCIMETELESYDRNPDMPSFIEIVEDVTGRFEYSNASMSRCFPMEITKNN